MGWFGRVELPGMEYRAGVQSVARVEALNQ